ncbi:hypothetical protein MTBLM1_10508 [Rhodospirillaceae bacterium LM-1]|nr:hypothetical protein MTBLM1_10508 [Rhodospirillaceae bacterium LM-1]
MESIQRRIQEILDAALYVSQVARPLRLFLRIEPEVERLGYVARPIDLPDGVELVEDAKASADLALFTHHGLDVAPAIWSWRMDHPGRLVLLWAWDNHLGLLHNLHSALAADLVFPSHAYASAHLMNPMSILGPHLPACCAQWQGGLPPPSGQRSDMLMAHYVDYPWAGRTKLLGELAGQDDWADVRRMSPENKQGYFGQTPERRLREWLGYKVSLVLPVDRDLSTRFFDALYAGQIPLLAGDFPDLDAVATPEERKRLGILQVDGTSLTSVREGHAEALALFDAMGEEGLAARHRYATQGHMMRQRIERALGCVSDLVQQNRFQARFNVAPCASGLRLTSI